MVKAKILQVNGLEKSLLVIIGCDRQQAVEWVGLYNQNAIVWCGVDAIPELIVL